MDAVIFQSTGDPGFNTNAPTGVLTNSGWQYEGTWGSAIGTVIAPRFFITAKHVDIGVTTNQIFHLNGVSYHPIAKFTTLSSDLDVWKTAETFPLYAPLYTLANEAGGHVVVFGRGTQRGAPVVVGGVTNGWQWGAPDGVQRWGENDVSSTTNGGTGVGDLLRCTFDAGIGSNECDTSQGDSGAGLFIQDGGVWKLAGVNYEADGPFSNAVDGTVFNAALVDVRGLFQEVGPDVWQFISGPQPVPSAFYSTRISANLNWINTVINFVTGSDLPIPTPQPAGNGTLVSFASNSNRVYYVQRNTDLLSGSWITFTNGVQGTGGTVSVLDTNSVGIPQAFYRVGLVK